jgi:hypothetical protein
MKASIPSGDSQREEGQAQCHLVSFARSVAHIREFGKGF